MRNNFKNRLGFSLVEMLVASSVFIAVSTVILVALFASFRVSKKSDALITVKQNGDAAMSQIVRNIKYAQYLDNPTSCVTPVTQSSLTITSSTDNGQTTFSCLNAPANNIASNGATMMDGSAVKVISCSFSCSQPTIDTPPTITIQFALSAITQGSNFVESTGTIPFQTSVTMRNFTR